MPRPATMPPAPLALAERLALAALGTALVVPPWWLGASTVAGQLVALAAGALALVAAFLAARHRLAAWPAAATAPAPVFAPIVVFCVGAFLALLLCQALNPDRLLIPDRRPVGRILPLPHLAFLPTGIAGPFDRVPGDTLQFANAWRHLLVAAAAILPVATLASLRHRVPFLRATLGLLALHAVLFSAFAFAHNLSGSRAVLWLVSDASFHLGAPQFPFKNQQAAYQILLLALVLAAWFAPADCRPWRDLPRRHLWMGLATAAVFLGTATTRSRAGLVGTAALTLLAAALSLWPLRHRWRWRWKPLALAGGATGLLLASLLLLPPVRATIARIPELARDPGTLLAGGSFRRILHDIAWEMTLDRPWFGHGAGCYLPLFPTYQARVPDYMAAIRRDHPTTHRPVHPHADGDWLEFTAEFGLVGTALLAAPWLVWFAALRRAWSFVPATLLLATGTAFVLVHGWVDFVLRNPAIVALAATGALLALTIARSFPAPRLPLLHLSQEAAESPTPLARLHPPFPSA